MSFDPWTLGFQLLNFGVLLLVLSRLLFRPIREIMAQRAAGVEAALAAAEKARAEAGELAAGLAREQERVGTLRVEMLERLHAEVEEHRQRRLAGAGAEAQVLIDRGRAVLETERRKAEEELRARARRSATGFAAAVLTDIADLELHRALLRRLPAALERAAAGPPEARSGEAAVASVESAFPLTDGERAALRSLLGTVVPVADLSESVAPSLIAGVRLRVADRLYDFSLQGQLDALAATLKAQP